MNSKIPIMFMCYYETPGECFSESAHSMILLFRSFGCNGDNRAAHTKTGANTSARARAYTQLVNSHTLLYQQVIGIGANIETLAMLWLQTAS